MALLNGFKETETEQQYRRGEIYYINNASKEHIGSEMKKDRPAVIVSCDANNKHSDVLEVVFLTSAPKKDLPTHVTIRSTGRKSEALCEQPTPVSVERINNFVGKASEKEMEQIDIALLIGLGIKLAGATEDFYKLLEVLPIPVLTPAEIFVAAMLTRLSRTLSHSRVETVMLANGINRRYAHTTCKSCGSCTSIGLILSLLMIGRSLGQEYAISACGYFLCNRYA